MKFIEKHKAVIVTTLVTGIVVLGLFSIHLTQQNEFITESFYQVEPVPEPEMVEEELQEIDDINAKSTNKAFNEDQEYEEMMRNFKTVSSDDFERTTEEVNEPEPESILEDNDIDNSYTKSSAYALKSEETSSYQKLQEQLKKRLENKKQADEHSKTRSTLTYSLKGRVLQNYKIPRYLCENGGKIVVSIKVSGSGTVTDTSINGASSSKDQCLVDSALSYAQSVRFDTSENREQIGTITFSFKGKN